MRSAHNFKEHLDESKMNKNLGPGDSIAAAKADVNFKRPQTQQSVKTIVAPVAWVRRFSIEDRLKVNNIELMPSTSLCSLEATIKSFHAMELVKKIILQHLQRCSTTACWLGFLVSLFAIVDVEISHRLHRNYNSSEYTPMLSITEIAVVVIKSIISFLTLLMCINVYLTYVSLCKFNIAKNLLPDSATIFNSNLLFHYLLESLLCLLHVPPLTDIYLGIPYKLQLFVLLRMYVVVRYMKEHNQFTKNKTCLFLASVTRTEFSNMFLFKTFLKKMPFKVIVTTYLINVFVGAYVIYVLEDKDSYLDSTWMVIVTMTTLGFGDVVPVTFLGRVLTGLMSILGIFLMALLITVVHESLQLNQKEKRILAHLENSELHDMKKIAAAKLIQSYWRFYSYIKTNREALAWKRIRKVARLKKLKNALYCNLHQWRQQKNVTGRNWYREFINDDIAMMITDVARAVDKIQLALNKTEQDTQEQKRMVPSKKGFFIDKTIFEECPSHESDECDEVTKPVNGSCNHNNGGCQSTPNNIHTHVIQAGVTRNNTPPTSSNHYLVTSPVSEPCHEIGQKLETMEDYLDRFYTKAKADVRDLKNLLQSDLTGANPSPDKHYTLRG